MMGAFFDLFDLWKRQATLAGGFAALAPSAGFVVASRVAQMSAEFGRPSAAGMREAERMFSEKVAAAVEGGFAAGNVLAGLSTAAGPLAAAEVLVSAGEAAVKPAATRLRANARRLSRG